MTGKQIQAGIDTIKQAIEDGKRGVDVELTASGVLLHVLMDLGIQPDTTGEYL
jgi:hypothetical protein